MQLLLSLRSELLKTKRTATLYLCLIASAVIPFVFLLETCIGTLEPETLQDPWKAFFMGGLSGMGFIILPMYVILISTLLPQIEYRNNTWKQVLVSPQRQSQLFLAKFLVSHIYILLLLVLFTLLMFIAGGLSQLILSEVSFFSAKSNWIKFFTRLGNLYTGILAISAIQFWLGTRLKNFIGPIGIGFALWMLASALLFEFKWTHVDKFPFSYPVLNIFPTAGSDKVMLAWSSLGYAVFFVIVGYLDFRGKIIKA